MKYIKKCNTKCNIKNIKIKNIKYNIKLNMSIMKKTQDTAKSLYPVFFIIPDLGKFHPSHPAQFPGNAG